MKGLAVDIGQPLRGRESCNEFRERYLEGLRYPDEDWYVIGRYGVSFQPGNGRLRKTRRLPKLALRPFALSTQGRYSVSESYV